MVNVAVYQNSIVLSDVALSRGSICFSVYINWILVWFLLWNITISLGQVSWRLILANILASDDHVELCFSVAIGIDRGDAINPIWVLVVAVIDHVGAVDIRVLIEVLDNYVVIIKFLWIPNVAHWTKVLHLPVLWTSSRPIEIAVASWDEGAARIVQSSRRYSLIHYYNLWWLQRLPLGLGKLWLHLKARHQLLIPANIAWYWALVATSLARLASILILWVRVAVVFRLLGSQGKMLGQEIIVFCLQLCILLLCGLVLAAIENFKVHAHWTSGSWFLLIFASSCYWGILVRTVGGAVVIHDSVGIIKRSVILVTNKILIFRSCHGWILILLVSHWLVALPLHDGPCSRLTFILYFLIVFVLSTIWLVRVLTEFKQAFCSTLAWDLRYLIVAAHWF